jgi:hypothetical protein
VTSWRLAPDAPAGVTVDPSGKVSIGSTVPEGTFEIAATAANKETKVSVEVTSPARYDELLASSGLNASGENDAASVVGIASTSIGAGEGRVEDRAKQRRWMFIGLVGGVLFILAILATVLLRRARRAKALEAEAAARHETEVAEVLARRRGRHEEHAAQKRAHDESVAAAAAARARANAAALAHAASLKAASPAPHAPPGPVPTIPAGSTSAPPKRGKICPNCGDRFEGAAEYCGKDGTQLVLIN